MSLPPEIEARLDGLLEPWASRARLSPGRAAEIRAAVLEEPAISIEEVSFPVLGYEWWQALMKPAATALAMTTANPAVSGVASFTNAPTAWLIQPR